MVTRRIRRIRPPENSSSRPGFAGIDPSMGGFAIATGAASDPLLVSFLKTETPDDHASVRARLDRWHTIADYVVARLEHVDPQIVVIEQYAFSKAGSSLGELGGIYRDRIAKRWPNAELIEVLPNTLKKFMTGSGNASKAKMVTAVARATPDDFDIATDDIADAFALAEMARAWLRLPSAYPKLNLTEARLATLARVKRSR